MWSPISSKIAEQILAIALGVEQSIVYAKSIRMIDQFVSTVYRDEREYAEFVDVGGEG